MTQRRTITVIPLPFVPHPPLTSRSIRICASGISPSSLQLRRHLIRRIAAPALHPGNCFSDSISKCFVNIGLDSQVYHSGDGLSDSISVTAFRLHLLHRTADCISGNLCSRCGVGSACDERIKRQSESRSCEQDSS
ncbi:hypothetical protein L2E82_29977 [Cichorium intybus]|uniref:Uncharacterized protein n=1 Tax=Cichorium intybus TaxID=13427 RepID=A0ACB9CYY2_CICIN|nr:hypothetical protein L2E82_29977 [Cichorium intybus]